MSDLNDCQVCGRRDVGQGAHGCYGYLLLAKAFRELTPKQERNLAEIEAAYAKGEKRNVLTETWPELRRKEAA